MLIFSNDYLTTEFIESKLIFDDLFPKGKNKVVENNGRSGFSSRAFWKTLFSRSENFIVNSLHSTRVLSRLSHHSLSIHSRRRSCEKAHRDEFCRVHTLSYFVYDTCVDDPPLPSSLRC